MTALWTSARRLRLHLQLLLLRHGAWPALLLGLTAAAAIATLAAALHRHEQLGHLQQQVHATQAQQQGAIRPAPAPGQAPPSPGEALWAALPGEDSRQRQTQALFTLARQQGLQVNQATYLLSPESQGAVQSVQVTLPLRGSYPAARRWVLGLLQTMPNVSVDALEMERESPAQVDLDIQASLSIWQQAAARGGAVAPSASAARARP